MSATRRRSGAETKNSSNGTGGHLTVEDVIGNVSAEFDPVALRLDLERATEDRRNTEFTLRYFGSELSLSVRVELGDFFIYPMVFWSEGKEEPPEYKDGRGRRRKIYFQAALLELGVPGAEAELKGIQHLGGDYRNCKEMASRLARMVERDWATIARASQRLFPGVRRADIQC